MNELTLDQACAKHGIERKALIGRCLRNDFEDPLVIDRIGDGEYLIADDWRLERLQSKSKGCQHA